MNLFLRYPAVSDFQKIMNLRILVYLISLLLPAGIYQRTDKSPQELMSLVQAERSFAAMSVEKGIRDSFLAFFADDGINFQPHPVNLKESYSKRPPPPDPKRFTLNWSPVYGDISAAGDLGYSTGPYTLTDSQAAGSSPQHGMFFSVWKKQKDGAWKVAVDMGVQLAEAYVPLDSVFKPARVTRQAKSGKKESLLKAEKEFFDYADIGSASNGWKVWLYEDARIYRNLREPVTNKKALEDWIKKQDLSMSGETIGADIAMSGDIAYSYGSYQMRNRNDSITEKGYYVRVWRFFEANGWKIVFDVANPLPEDQK